MNFGTNIHYMSGQCWKGFQGQKSRSWPDQLTYIGASIPIDGVALKSTCFTLFGTVLHLVTNESTKRLCVFKTFSFKFFF